MLWGVSVSAILLLLFLADFLCWSLAYRGQSLYWCIPSIQHMNGTQQTLNKEVQRHKCTNDPNPLVTKGVSFGPSPKYFIGSSHVEVNYFSPLENRSMFVVVFPCSMLFKQCFFFFFFKELYRGSLTYSKLNIFKAYSLVSFDICMNLSSNV